MAKLKAENSSLKKACFEKLDTSCHQAFFWEQVNRRLKGLLEGSEPEPLKRLGTSWE